MTEENRLKGVDEKFCTECGAVIKLKAEICPKCGCRQGAVTSSDKKNKTVAAVLALFLGGLGIHKFYLGNTLPGILYLVFCWTFIPSVIAFVEAVLLFLMSDAKFDSKYNLA
ncbi:MAG: TM2 domain-containing protein [Burkholderiales bacterium]|nr:TM2 domain-containing protein [Burkholderiales bacterium]